MTFRSLPGLMKAAAVLAALALTPAAALAQQPTAYPGGTWQPGPARFGVEIEDGVRLRMDDGVELAATIAWPTDLATGARAPGPFPVVVEHMPYTNFAAAGSVTPYFAQYGYISVQVRVRGLGQSGGEVQFLGPRDGLDGKEIIDWAAHDLASSDSRVGLIGCSWPGVTALNDAGYVGENSPLKAVVAACSGLGNMQRQSWLGQGMPTMSFWNFDALGAQLTGNTEAGKRFFADMTRDVMAGTDRAFGGGTYWSERAPVEMAEQIVANDVPVLLWAGWGDVVETGTVRAYLAFQNASAGRPVFAPMLPDQPVDPRYQMIMGGWHHSQGLDAGVYLQWLETWVRGVDTGIQTTTTPMHVFETGSERWLNLTGYPQAAANTRWMLGENGAIGVAPQPAGSATLAFGQPDATNGTVRFDTGPIQPGTILTGPISATIYASSTTTDMVMITRLYDLDPAGNVTLVSRGAMIASQRVLDTGRSWTDAEGTITWPWPLLTHEEPLTPGEVYRLDVSLAPRQHQVLPGHRLRLELTTQTPLDLCPPDAPPPTNDTDPCRLTTAQQQRAEGGVYTVMFGGDTPSSLNLPQLPVDTFTAVPAGPTPTPWSEGTRQVSDPAMADQVKTLPLVWNGTGQ